ncbi:MAG TPA: DoxX family protein [Chryseolinea sp.]|nr:DoxX family protein [Chryseolinea sp.]
MKKDKIIFWSATTILFLFQGVMPALTSHTEMAREGIRQLGYPAYFGTMLSIFKIAGAVVLMFPQFPKKLREWAYAGFAFDFISACVSNSVVYGLGSEAVSPLIALLILGVSYIYYHRLHPERTQRLDALSGSF